MYLVILTNKQTTKQIEVESIVWVACYGYVLIKIQIKYTNLCIISALWVCRVQRKQGFFLNNYKEWHGLAS